MIEKNYTIVIADDHKLIISGINHIIKNNNLGIIIAEVNTGIQVLQFLQCNLVDLIILDINMPELNGVLTAEKVVKMYPNTAILMLSQYESVELIKKLQKIGVKGYLSKNFEIHQLIEAIETIKRNEVFFPSLAINNSIFKKDKFHLTCREIEIITLISLGHTSKEIANKLFLSQYTIDTHRKNCMRKLEVNSSLTLISAAKDLGYIL